MTYMIHCFSADLNKEESEEMELEDLEEESSDTDLKLEELDPDAEYELDVGEESLEDLIDSKLLELGFGIDCNRSVNFIQSEVKQVESK